MKRTTALLLLTLLALSSCYQQTHPQRPTNTCWISAEEVLSCVASSANLTCEEVSSKFDTLLNTPFPASPPARMNKLLCLSLHKCASMEHRQKGEKILQKILKYPECRDQTLSGVLLLTQGNIELYKKYLDKNWTSYLKNKKSYKEQEAFIQQLESEALSCKRRIQDLEQQVQKLKEIELMLDNKIAP